MYISGVPTKNIKDVWDELVKIENELSVTDHIELRIYNKAPSKPRTGHIFYADGTNWDPGGTGEGLYFYNSSGNYIKL